MRRVAICVLKFSNGLLQFTKLSLAILKHLPKLTGTRVKTYYQSGTALRRPTRCSRPLKPPKALKPFGRG